jgi:hypothetical protein
LHFLLQPRFLSLSLDSLLDYTDKDVEESTFEVCLYNTVYIFSLCMPKLNEALCSV